MLRKIPKNAKEQTENAKENSGTEFFWSTISVCYLFYERKFKIFIGVDVKWKD